MAVHFEVAYPVVILDLQGCRRLNAFQAGDLAGVDAFDEEGKCFLSLGLQLL